MVSDGLHNRTLSHNTLMAFAACSVLGWTSTIGAVNQQHPTAQGATAAIAAPTAMISSTALTAAAADGCHKTVMTSQLVLHPTQQRFGTSVGAQAAVTTQRISRVQMEDGRG